MQFCENHSLSPNCGSLLRYPSPSHQLQMGHPFLIPHHLDTFGNSTSSPPSNCIEIMALIKRHNVEGYRILESFGWMLLNAVELVGWRVWSHLRWSRYLACVMRRRLAHLTEHLYNMTSSSINDIRRLMMMHQPHTGGNLTQTQVHNNCMYITSRQSYFMLKLLHPHIY